ncbi:sirohydrochlorin chelatase [Nonomuraea cavernae]|uniref:sirohydrochlorin chelatase n=1 Tax=Nonomuraea cavernae TaxID=2045107 RepID=UPI003409DB90
MTTRPRDVLLAAGHESLGGASLRDLLGPGTEAHAAGRDLAAAVRDHAGAVIVPMTLGRDPDLAATAAQTLAWAGRDRTPGDLLLAEPLGSTEHLVGWIKAAIGRVMRAGPPPQAVLLSAPAAGRPEEDAELFKVAHLVGQGLPVGWVEVALTGGRPDVPESLGRCRLLGASDVLLVPASFVTAPELDGVRTAGPLLGPAGLAALIRDRVATAERRWRLDGDDGLTRGGRAAHHHHDHEHEHNSLERATFHVG